MKTETQKSPDVSSLDVDAGSEFAGYAEPLGTRITLHPANTPRVRMAVRFFEKEMFDYFHQLVSGATGWGICYRDWLEINGWKLIGFTTFERVRSIEDELSPNVANEPRR